MPDLNFTANTPSWYASLTKPAFAPPSWLFGPVWSVLYVLIGIGFFYALRLYRNKKLDRRLIVAFVINLLANFTFSPLQFGLQNNLLALADILIVLGTLLYLEIKFWPKHKLLFWTQLPYLLWVSFATLLQVSITYLNW